MHDRQRVCGLVMLETRAADGQTRQSSDTICPTQLRTGLQDSTPKQNKATTQVLYA